MRFPYLPLPTRRPVFSLGGVRVRYRPIVPVQIIGPLGSRSFDCCLDCGTDDTIFPLPLIKILGIHLTSPPDEGESLPVGGHPVTYPYGLVELRISDGAEAYEWRATVGFIDTPLAWPLLGLAGFFQFFDVELLGARLEAVLKPSASFTGRVIQRAPAP